MGEAAMMAKKTEEVAAAPVKKKRGLRAMLFGRKKKTEESEGETEGATPDVGFVAKSHSIPVEEDLSPVPVPEKEAAEKQETSGGPTWGDDEQPLILETTQCADARDSSAGYPVLEGDDTKPAETK